MLDLSSLTFRYEPYPIGLARPAMPEPEYKELLAAFPPRELFTYLEKVGHKYVLSEKFNSAEYHRFVQGSPVWREFHAQIKRPEFILSVLDTLVERGIDLGLKHFPASPARHLKVLWKDLKRGRFPRLDLSLSSRFEFSMLPVTGGHVTPHTDSPGKIITLVVSMVDEWDGSIGGGTDVIRPLDPTRSYNKLNRKLDFSEIEVLDTFDFSSNQVVLFTKTFNSWHCVRPMTGSDPELMRKTLTINIEEDD